jgi:hypothetical protein
MPQAQKAARSAVELRSILSLKGVTVLGLLDTCIIAIRMSLLVSNISAEHVVGMAGGFEWMAQGA